MRRARGDRVLDIARDLGCSKQAVSDHTRRQAALIARLTAQHEADLVDCYQTAVTGLAKDLASRSAVTRHNARVALLKYITAADRLARAESAGDVDLREVLLVYGRIVSGS